MRSLGHGSPKLIVAVAIGVAAVAGAAWAIAAWSTTQQDKQLLPKELSAKVLADEARHDPQKLAETMRETFRRDDLTQEQRRALRRNMRHAWESVLDDRINEYYAAAPEQREAVLDRQIDEWQERMKQWRERRRQREKERRAQGGDTGKDGESADDQQSRRRRWGPQTREQRKARSESRNPDKVARRTAYFMAVRKRAKARGIQMFGPHVRPRRAGGRGR